MRVIHSGTLVASAGGPAMSTYLTLRGLIQQNVDAHIIMYAPKREDVLRGNDVPIHIVNSLPISPLAYSSRFRTTLFNSGHFDIYHAQGVWQWPTYALVDVARKRHKPYLITPRGMLYPQDIAKSNTFFKKLSLRWRLLNDLNRAACVHVTCEDEMIHCRNLGVTAPIAIISNPVEIKSYPYKKEDDVRRIGYLGRVSRRKNIEGLICAFHELKAQTDNAELLIVGSGEKEYERYLHQLVDKFSLKNVRFAGFLSGVEKDKAIASCSILAMPSEFENLGNVVLEGLVRGIPCIATTGSPWRELETYHCGWWVPYTQGDITHAVYEALNVSQIELNAMGKNGRLLMENNYSVTRIGEQMKSLYEWVMGTNNKPNFVYE